MENILGIVGTITGVLGLFVAVFIAVRQVQSEKTQAKERAEEKEMHAKERAEEKEMHAKELEIEKQEKARSDRLIFLADRIFDSTIPRELRLPFYEEYISMKGNGTAVRFWLLEAEREKKEQKPG